MKKLHGNEGLGALIVSMTRALIRLHAEAEIAREAAADVGDRNESLGWRVNVGVAVRVGVRVSVGVGVSEGVGVGL